MTDIGLRRPCVRIRNLIHVNAEMPEMPTFEALPPAPGMNPFANSTTQRRTALTVMLVWLFALVSGVANACFLDIGAPHGDGMALEHAVADARAPHQAEGHAHSRAQHPQSDSAAATALCLKVCDDGGHALPRQASVPETGQSVPVPVPVPLFVVHWPDAPVLALADGLTEFWPPPQPGLPIRVRFSRLAL